MKASGDGCNASSSGGSSSGGVRAGNNEAGGRAAIDGGRNGETTKK